MNNSYHIALEKEFGEMKRRIETNKKTNKRSGVVMVLQYMLSNPDKIWFCSWDFIGKRTPQGEYLSHRSPARASDLSIYHPDLVEMRKVLRFSIYRLRRENLKEILKFIETNA